MKQNKALNLLKHFQMHPSRAKTLNNLILAVVKAGSVQFRKLAHTINSETKIDSIIRRIQRFFQFQHLSIPLVGAYIFKTLSLSKKIIFTLDRTNWKFGKTEINFLVLGVVYKGCSIPLNWILLPHKANSKSSMRIGIMESIFSFVQIDQIAYIIADREFIGQEWFLYLKKQGIPFCIRLKENMMVVNTHKGGFISLRTLFKTLSGYDSREIQQTLAGIPIRICATRTITGELLILAVSAFDDCDPFELYKKRWSIETMFKSLKSNGFNFEDTHLHDSERLGKMMAVLAIAFAYAVKIGEIRNNIRPIRVKKHQRSEFSFFSYGFNVIQVLLGQSQKMQKKLIRLLQKITLNTSISSKLAGITVVY